VKVRLTTVMALVALTSAALAEEAVELTDAQMDRITAGQNRLEGRGIRFDGLERAGAGSNQRRLQDDVIDTLLSVVSNQPTDQIVSGRLIDRIIDLNRSE
jgi:hypothetical protein